MYNQIIYIEKQIASHPNTLKICKQFNKAEVIYINHYKDVFNQTNANWRVQKANQKIILAKRNDNFYYKGSDITPSFGYQHFYYNTVALNCIYDCAYCYLQGLFGSANMVLFVNNEDFITATTQLLNQINQPVYFALSYDTDLLAIENWLPYCEEWITAATLQPNLIIEIRTKSANINAIAHLKAIPNVVLAWTISPQVVIEAYESKTPPLLSRLKAIKKAQELGWRVRICIDPIIDIDNWVQVYSHTINQIAENVNLSTIDSISLGVFRMNKAFLKQMQKQRQDVDILYKPYVLNDDCYTLEQNEKAKMYQTLINALLIEEETLQIEVL
jgi:spore photoproduct lyase